MPPTSSLQFNKDRQLTDGIGATLITREKLWPRDARPDFPFDEITVRTGSPHVYQRYIDAAMSTCKTVYVQDDDCAINVRYLWSKYDGRITNANTAYFIEAYAGTGITLVGWGCFFPRQLAEDFCSRESELRQLVGDDLFFAEADRLFTYLNQPHNQVLMPVAMFQRQTQRMCNRPTHYTDRAKLVQILKEAYPCVSV